MNWNPDPKILLHLKAEFMEELEALKACPDPATFRRVASLMYYAAELRYKLLNPWYCPPRFLTGSSDGMMNLSLFQQAGVAATEQFIELSGDLVLADFNFPGRGRPLSGLQAKSARALEHCGLQEVPGMVEWIKNET